jgi:hypothetical protein
MSFEEEFDRILRQKANEAEYPFDEKNWEKARAMVDADRKSDRKRPVALFYSVALLLLSLGVAGWLLIAGADEVAVPVKAVAENTALAEAEKDTYKMAQVSVPLPKAAVRTISAPQKPRPVPVSATTQSDRVKTVAASEASPLPTDNVVPSSVAQNNSAGSGAGDVPENNRPASGKNNPPVQNVQALPAEKEEPARADASLPLAEQPAKTADDQPAAISEQPVIASEVVSYEYLNPIHSRLPMPSMERELKPTLRVNDQDYYKKKRFKTHFLNVEAGATYLAGWDVKGGKDGKGLNWFGGLNYGLYVSRKIALGAGLQVYNIAHIEKPFYSTSSTQYGFGSTGTRTVITTGSLYYIALPVKVYYLLNAHSQFGAGVNIGMPVEARSTVETFGLSDHVVVDSKKTTRAGVYKGINTTNILLSAFYKTQVAKRFYLNGEVIYGISDIFENLEQTTREQAIGFRLSLHYTLFDK